MASSNSNQAFFFQFGLNMRLAAFFTSAWTLKISKSDRGKAVCANICFRPCPLLMLVNLPRLPKTFIKEKID